MSTDIDLNTKVKFRETEHFLKDVLELCQPGESIEGLDVDYFDDLLDIFIKKRNKEYVYSIDRRYGKWRFILFGQRDD